MQCSALLHSVLHNLVVCTNIYKNVYSMLQARSQEFLRAGEVSVNQDTNSSQFRERKLNVNTKVSFFEKQLFLSYGDYFSKYPNPSYRFMIKRLPSGLNILTKKIKNVILSSYTIYSAFTFRRPLNSNNNESLLLLLDGLQKVKGTCIVLCLNASANLQNASVASCHVALMSNRPLCSHMP